MADRSAWWRVVLAVVMLAPAVVFAQAMYRCGATYQDRPCNGVDTKPVGSHVRQAAGQSTGAASIDPVCAARGTVAQKMMWEKESGRTLDEQLAQPGVDAGLARNVYGRRGSSLEVRRAIEADCLKDVAQANEAAALLRAAGRVPQSGATGNQPVLPAGSVAGASSAAKAANCASLAGELSELNHAQRAGGDAARMDVLAARVRDTQSRKKAAGC